MRIKIILSLLLFSGFAIHGSAQNMREDSIRKSNFLLKGTLVDFNFLSLPNLSLGLEFDVSPDWSIDLGLGYIYESIDEKTPARGFRFHNKFHQTVTEKLGTRSAVSLGYYYTHVFLNDYLLHEQSIRGSLYNKYIRRKYSKERYGITAEFMVQRQFPNTNWFLEMNVGMMVSRYRTLVPTGVIQRDFRNGLFYGKDKVVPSPTFKLKLGYLFFGN